MQRQRGLAIFVGGEILRQRSRDGGVARNNALHQPPHGFNAERQGNHIQQQQLAVGVVARQLVGLDGGPKGHHFIGVEIGQQWLAKKCLHRLAHSGHAGGAAHHHHALNIGFGQTGIAQRLAHGNQGAGCEGLCGSGEFGRGHAQLNRTLGNLHIFRHGRVWCIHR